MTRTAADYELFLRDAVETYDEMTASQLVKEMVLDLEDGRVEVNKDQAKAMLSDLRKKRYFALLEEAASALKDAGRDEPAVQKHLVQGLIDQGKLAEAELEVRELINRTSISEFQGAEARGLLGRIHKQAYVNPSTQSGSAGDGDSRPEGDPGRLQQAINEYLAVYRHDPAQHYWHGINVVACLARAERDGVQVETETDWRILGTEIFDRVKAARPNQDDYTWQMATALEAKVAACLDNGDVSEAHPWAERYIRAPYADAFELGSTIRQLREVWQIEGRPGPERAILNTLVGAQLLRRGGSVKLSSQELQTLQTGTSFEGTLGREARISMTHLSSAFQACQGVGRVETEDGDWEGTGFLLDGRSLKEDWGTEPVFVTNAHVVRDPPLGRGMPSASARIHFSAVEGAGDRVEVKEVLWQSGRVYDTTVLRLATPPPNATVLVHGKRPSGSEERLPIIGHPLGQELQFSLFDNHFVGYKDPCFLRYRSSTDHGSSGSPVFDEDWRVVAAHHAKRLVGNEGILLDALREVIGENPKGMP